MMNNPRHDFTEWQREQAKKRRHARARLFLAKWGPWISLAVVAFYATAAVIAAN